MPAGALADNQQGGDQGGEKTFQCNNQVLGAVLIDGNLVVPPGARCELIGTHVTGNARAEAGPPEPADPTSLSMTGARIDGNVLVQENAQFAAFAGSTVGGDVRCNRCEVADVHESTVMGNHDENAVSEGAFISNSHIGGSLTIHDGTDFAGVGFHIVGNTVGENLVFNRNRGVVAEISGNRVAENLVCNGNTPPPVGGGNTAERKTGQCRLL